MKAEITEDLKLILIFESDEEMQIIFNWVKANNGKYYIPDNRRELAPTRIEDIDIYITRGIK